MALQPQEPQSSALEAETSDRRVTLSPTIVQHAPSEVHMYNLREDQLDQLTSLGPALSVGLCTTFLSLFAAFGIVLLSVENLPDRTFLTFVGLTWASLGLFAITLIWAVRDFRRIFGVRKVIKRSDEPSSRIPMYRQ
jgi:hypothetical protein